VVTKYWGEKMTDKMADSVTLGETVRGHMYIITGLSVDGTNLSGIPVYIESTEPYTLRVLDPHKDDFFKQYKITEASSLDVKCQHLGEMPDGQWHTIQSQPSDRQKKILTDLLHSFKGQEHHGWFRR